MPLIVNTNVASLNAQRNLTINTNLLNRNYERLSSGYRINRAADDAAGLQISEALRSQIRGVSQAINNAQDGNNLLSIAEGTLSTIQDHLQRIRELTVQAANDTNGADQRTAISDEITARLQDISRIANATQFNGTNLLTGSAATFRLQIGPNDSAANDVIDIGAALATATATAIVSNFTGTVDVGSNSAARTFLAQIDNALDAIGERRAQIGTYQNRLDAAIQNLQIARENFSASESRIRNVDVAAEAADLTRNQILQQASASILAQANQAPSLALSLIQR